MKRNQANNQVAMLASNTLKAMLLFALFSIFFFGCKDSDTPTPEKVVVMFGLEEGEGELRAFVEQKALKSPAEVEKGKSVRFQATYSKSWAIKYWKVNGEKIRSVEPEQTFEADKHLDVRVALKPWNE